MRRIGGLVGRIGKASAALRGDETFRGKAGEFPVKRGGEEAI